MIFLLLLAENIASKFSIFGIIPNSSKNNLTIKIVKIHIIIVYLISKEKILK